MPVLPTLVVHGGMFRGKLTDDNRAPVPSAGPAGAQRQSEELSVRMQRGGLIEFRDLLRDAGMALGTRA